MISKKIYLSLILILFSHSALSLDKVILCDPPQGTRVDYFAFNNINLQNQTFLMSRDQVSGMRPKLIIGKNSVTFIIGDASEVKTTSKGGNMQVLLYNGDQISFSGMVNGAPILGTFYPKMNILIYSQQSIWPGPSYKGARAVIFYSKCINSK